MWFLTIFALLIAGSSGRIPVKLISHWNGGFKGEFCIPFDHEVTHWTVRLRFSEPLKSLEVWRAQIESQSEDGREFVLVNQPYNGNEHVGDTLCASFLGHGHGDIHPDAYVIFGDTPDALTPPAETTTTTTTTTTTKTTTTTTPTPETTTTTIATPKAETLPPTSPPPATTPENVGALSPNI